MNSAELLTNDKTFENLIFFIQMVRMSKHSPTEDMRMSAGNLADSWETMLLEDGMSMEQLMRVRRAI